MADTDFELAPVVPSVETAPAVPPVFGETQDFSLVPVGRTEVPPEKQTRWGEAAKSGLMKLGTTAAMMQGDTEHLITQLPNLGYQAYAFGREKLGIPVSPEDRASQEARAQSMSGLLEERREKGPFGGIPGGERLYAKAPTSEEVNKAINPYAEKAFGVGPEMKPRTPQEAIVQEGLSLAGGNWMGPFKGLAKRMATGVAGGAASEGAGQAAHGTAWEIPARLTGMVAGSKFAQPVLNAAETVAKSVTPMGAREKLAGVLSDPLAESSAAARRMAQTEGIKDVAAEFPARMRGFVQNVTGVDARGPAFQARLEELGKAERQRVYDAARATPAAQAIDDAPFAALRERPIFQEAEAAAKENAPNLPAWDLRAPETVKGTPYKEARWEQTDRGFREVKEVQAVPDKVVPGNLQHYDETKKQLDSIIEQASRSGDKPKLAAAMDAKDELLKILDPLIPEYKAARGIASDTFKAADAPQAGARFLTTHDLYGTQEFIDAFKTYTPGQQQAFEVGLLHQLEEDIVKNPDLIAKRFIKNPDLMEKLSLVFGKETAQAIRGKALSENLLQQANKIRADITKAEQSAAVSGSALKKGAVAGTGILGLSALQENLPMVANFLATHGVPQAAQILGAAGAATVAGGAYAMNKVEQRIANQMVALAKKNDVASFTKIANMMDDYPGVYNKVLGPLMVISEEAEKRAGERPARASGGAVNLMALSKAAKKQVTQSTEALLNESDDTVARALEVANKHI
jgi:hypothetical protein